MSQEEGNQDKQKGKDVPAGPSGTKDSYGCVIHDTIQAVNNRFDENMPPVMEMENATNEFDKETEEPPRKKKEVPMQNAFAALNLVGEEDEIIPHIPFRRAQATRLDNAAPRPQATSFEQSQELHIEGTEAATDIASMMIVLNLL
ncbi:hypothetical protein FRX31_020247 [Thalictrum thalictroides]|uniref:Uncharacterized protein n=1 Tax=Thalictrum thalictroides TaxID=46969 RepID=A0A7J6VYG2_THATH|nr:hypothetical protein FRX31_020247 [Thalictrum thalictroides]